MNQDKKKSEKSEKVHTLGRFAVSSRAVSEKGCVEESKNNEKLLHFINITLHRACLTVPEYFLDCSNKKMNRKERRGAKRATASCPVSDHWYRHSGGIP